MSYPSFYQLSLDKRVYFKAYLYYVFAKLSLLEISFVYLFYDELTNLFLAFFTCFIINTVKTAAISNITINYTKAIV